MARRTPRFPVVCLAMLLAATAAPVAPAEAPGPARERLEAFVDGLEGLRATFTQVSAGPDGSAREETGGEVWLAAPDRLRWRTGGDFPELIVADGERVWVYDEVLEQVTVKPQPDEAAGTPLILLTDLESLDAQYRSVEVGNVDEMYLLSLDARDAEAEFERLLIGVADDGVRLMVLEDAFGQRTEIRFDALERNPAFEPGQFTFEPPPGADVVGAADLIEAGLR
jgi:outer membrane lipoprotein carrier protein